MFNMNTDNEWNTATTKLIGTERSCLSKQRTKSDLNDGTNYTVDNCYQCEGRGISIKKLYEPTWSINKNIDPELDFSNSSIEFYFKNLRGEKLKPATEKID
ncbi:Hypothetical protein CINCED_3A004185 [Cinara cedri]|uniref:Uncharacterized protein n=1 Tax=Cinara cedri TaxID=506608 RepID=A0A5E4N6F0_9HEMI|nr:Hypothetical protein CINCED_3A004185 [Cinara cedri]